MLEELSHRPHYDDAMSNTTLEMAPSFEGLPERQGQSCGLDEPDLGTLMIEEFSISDTAKKSN